MRRRPTCRRKTSSVPSAVAPEKNPVCRTRKRSTRVTVRAVREAVKQLGVEPASAEVSMIPQNYVKLEGKPAQQMVKLMEALDDHDDVQHVWSNFDISDKEIEASLA